jgi:tripartite-type tricarboxylate transporter receptor subunit TctC
MIAVSLAALSGPATANDFPSKPISFVVPYTAGGPYDTLTRYLTDSMRKHVRQPLIVENKPGGNTLLGIRSVLQAPADGYALLVSTTPISTNLLLAKNPGYKAEDFTAIAPVAKHPYILFVPSSLPVSNMAELKAYAMSNQAKLNIGVLAPGGSNQLLTDRFLTASGLKIEKIPYKGAADLATALLTGDIQMMFTAYSAGAPFLKDGKMKAIAIAQDERSTLAPDLPTFKELGMPSVSGETWVALFARSGTPKPVIKAIQDMVYAAAKEKEFLTRIEPMGIEPWLITPDKIQAYIDDDARKWEGDIKALALEPQ